MQIIRMTVEEVEASHAVQCKAFEERWWEPLSLFQSMYDFYPVGCFTIKDGEHIIGYIYTHPADEGREDYESAGWDIRGDETCLFIHDLCIDPAYQGKGIAQEGVAFIEEYARTSGFEKLIGIAVEGVEKFWEKQAFQMERPYLYNGHPATFMEKTL